MIDWINQNSSFLLVLLTSIYVFATIAILWMMGKSNLLAKESLEQTAKLEQARLRPYVSLILKISKTEEKNSLPFGYLILKNSGETQAYDIRVSMSPEIYSSVIVNGKKQNIHPYLIKEPISTLPPKTDLSDSIGFLSGIFEHFEKPKFTGEITYLDENKKRYRQSFVIDLQAMKDSTPYVES